MRAFYDLFSKTQALKNFQSSDLPLKDLQKAYDLWAALKEDKSLPEKADIDIRDFADILGHVALLEIEPEPFRARYIVAGGNLVSLYGKEVTGKYVDEAFKRSVAKEVLEVYRQVLESREPYYSCREFITPLRRLGYHRLILPFSDGGEGVRFAMLCLYPTDPNIVKASDWRHFDDVQYWLGKIK